ncbi:MAG TPA: hypothetical protein VFP72_09070 [Kineosporiaceae bacterium]|nr:hypothetical protein [Kineosporiaceae bacterium]
MLQAVAARRATRSDGLSLDLLVRLGSQLPYLGGLGLDLVGFVASLAALRQLPLFFVQSAIAGSVGVTAVVAVVALGTRLRRRETAALAGLGCGLVLLAVAAQPETATPLPEAARWGLLGGVALLVGYGVVLARLPGTAGAAGLAVGAGLGFAGVGIAARTITVPDPLWALAADPLTWAIAGYGILSILLFGTALQRGSVTTTSALTFAVETVVPAAVGITLLGDRPRPGFTVLALCGFVLTLVGAVLLARFAEPGEQPTPEQPADTRNSQPADKPQ